MKTVLRLNAFAILCCVFLIGCRSRERSGSPRILIFTKTADFHPASTAAGVEAIRKMGNENHFETDTTSDPSRFTEDSLRQYAAIVFLGTGDLLNNYQEADFERYLQAGGGFVGIPAAGNNGNEHALSRYQHVDGSRSWYEKTGYTEASWSDPFYLKHILAGIQYAIGKNEVPDYSKVRTLRVPEENRFTKTMLVEGQLFEPTEMTILPNLDVLIAQRRGEVLLYKNDSRQLQRAGFLNVYYKALTPAGSTEEGLLGIQADPDFASNHFVYLYYSPTDTPVDRLSRFSFKEDSLDPASEKIILQVNVQREICCHTGGSIAFGRDHDLFLSTGDNSTPFDEPGKPPFNLHSFAPLDDRPGHQRYDSRRGAGNTNDLRGKIIRIKIRPDGSYSIPEGNLFPPGEAKTRPEIYVMGDRNPYRISVDKKNEFLYWGEVGPDAANDSPATRGPRGYDEINQARKAGNFGWPYFVGNNYPYHEYDFNTGKSGIAFDPERPVNNSRNNTGLHALPPAQPAFIWYPYAESKDFPEVGTGGRTAMAGPVYHADLFPDSSRYPDYYNNKLFIYDWIRGWIKVVTLLPNGDFDKMEPFMPHTAFHAPIDMETGPDGRIYILEYGNGWYQQNPDAGLAVIRYNAGNRPPEISSLKTEKKAGLLPFKGTVQVIARDPENDPLSYSWNFGNGIVKETSLPEAEFNYTSAGDYRISVEVKDDHGATTSSKPLAVYAGNETPEVSIKVEGNRSFYLPGKPLRYAVSLNHQSNIPDPADLYVSADFTENGSTALNRPGAGESISTGRILTQTLDCKSCHRENEKSVGPSFMQVSEKYREDKNAFNYLTEKVTKGGSGVWGDVAMSSHPNILPTDLTQILRYILTLSKKEGVQKSLPASGIIRPPKETKPQEALLLSAVYSSRGSGNNIKALSGRAAVLLRSSWLLFTGKENKKGFTDVNQNNRNELRAPEETGWFALDSIDLSGVDAIDIHATSEKAGSYSIRVVQDKPDGKLLGNGRIESPASAKGGSFSTRISLRPVSGKDVHTVYFIFSPVDSKEIPVMNIESVEFR